MIGQWYAQDVSLLCVPGYTPAPLWPRLWISGNGNWTQRRQRHSPLYNKIKLYHIPAWTHDAQPPHARVALANHYRGFKTCRAPEQKCCLAPEKPTDLHYSLYPTRLRGQLHRFTVPQETRFSLINPNSIHTSTEQTFIHIQQGPLLLAVAGSRSRTGQLCFF